MFCFLENKIHVLILFTQMFSTFYKGLFFTLIQATRWIFYLTTFFVIFHSFPDHQFYTNINKQCLLKQGLPQFVTFCADHSFLLSVEGEFFTHWIIFYHCIQSWDAACISLECACTAEFVSYTPTQCVMSWPMHYLIHREFENCSDNYFTVGNYLTNYLKICRVFLPIYSDFVDLFGW